MTVAAAMIVREAAATVEQAVRSVRAHVDEVAVYLAGKSTDGTPGILDRLAAEPGPPLRVEQGAWEDDYGLARSRSFAMTEAPWVLYVDADEQLVGGEHLPEIVARADAAGANAAHVACDHLDGPAGKVWTWTPRIVMPGTGRWEGRVHEVWRRETPGFRNAVVAHPAALQVRHARRDERPGHYRALIERAAADPAGTPRALMMLGAEYLGAADVRAVGALRAYLAGNHDRVEGDPNTYRLQALMWIVQASQRLGLVGQARSFARQGEAYQRRLEQAVRDGTIENPAFQRWLEVNTEALASTPPVAVFDLLLAPPP